MVHFAKNLLFIIFSFCIFNVWSQVNVPPTIVATGDQDYCPLSGINVVTSFDIIDPDDTGIEALYIQISTGYDIGEDVLQLTGSHPNIVTSWDSVEGKLSLSGIGGVNVSYTDLIAAVNDVVYQGSSASISGDKYFSFTIGGANYLPSTGHYYEYVANVGITWSDAKAAAETRTYFGLQGYLVTITSSEEAQLSGEQAAGTGWIGASDEETEGTWKWMTGPEAGSTFWLGLGNGSTAGTDIPYAFWNTIGNEPNNFGNEDYAHIVSPNLVSSGSAIAGSWNDLPNVGGAVADYRPQGYVVEYGGMPGDPVLNISASTKISVASITSTTDAELCGSGSLVLGASSSSGDVVWFDSLTGGNQVHIGTSYTTPVLNATTNYYVLASVNGCLDGERTEVTATIKPVPTINSVSDAVICDAGSATLSAIASSGIINWYDVPSGGTSIAIGTSYTTPVVAVTTIYYVEAIDNGCTTASRTPVTLTVQRTLAPTGNALQTFCDLETGTVGDLTVTGIDVLWYATSTDTEPLNSTELLTSGTYYASQTENTCESNSRFAVSVIVYETIVPLTSDDIPVYDVCDDNMDGDDTNGISEFDLTEHEIDLLRGNSSTDFSFEYYTDPARLMPIPNPSTFRNNIPNNQTIYVRMLNNANPSCYTETEFNIRVNPLPEVLNSIVFKNCDEDGTPDGFTDFNLNEVSHIITTEDLDEVNITFHLTLGDAEQLDNPIIASPFNNQTSGVVYARVEYTDSACYRVSTINLEVSTTSFPKGYVQELELCDNDANIDGIITFDLTAASNNFIDQFPTGQNLSVHYYHNLTDAQLEENEIVNVSNYDNQIPFSETLFVRVESDDNGACFGIGSHLLLTVHPRPEFEVNQNDIFCLNGGPITLFTFNPNGNYSYEWVDGDGMVISNLPTAEVGRGGVYKVLATSSFGCQSFPVEFNVVESGKSDITIEDIGKVELSDNNSIVIDTTDIGVGDYEFALNTEFGPYKDSPIFNDVPAGDHILYVRDKNGCGITELDVFILGFPKFFTPNGDANNATWNISGLGPEYTSQSTIRIYDRYGKFIKQIVPGTSGWDGTFNGQELAVSDYWFVANLIDDSGNSKVYRGHFSLVR